LHIIMYLYLDIMPQIISLCFMKNKSIIIPIISMMISLTACKASQDHLVDKNDTDIEMVQNTPELLMINFSMDSRDSVKVINALKNPGRLRSAFNLKSEPSDGDLIISFLNEANIVCSKTIVENPMKRKVEYSDTDDLSTLKSQTVKLDSAEFFIRVQYDDCFKHLRVERFLDDQTVELKFLPHFKIPK